MAKRPGGKGRPGPAGGGARRWRSVALYVAVGAVLVGLVVANKLTGRRAPEPEGVETVADQPKYHLRDVSEKHEPYKSDPPVAGPHAGAKAAPGFYEEAVAAELLVHNLEDGDVVVYYRPGLPEDVMEELRALADRYADPGGSVVVVPREDKESAVILTAWRKILRLQSWDQGKAQAFIDRYLGVDHH